MTAADDPRWPRPAPDPYDEPGEDPETHLLPNLARLVGMTRAERRELLELVADWRGPLVEQFRRRVADLDGEP